MTSHESQLQLPALIIYFIVKWSPSQARSNLPPINTA